MFSFLRLPSSAPPSISHLSIHSRSFRITFLHDMSPLTVHRAQSGMVWPTTSLSIMNSEQPWIKAPLAIDAFVLSLAGAYTKQSSLRIWTRSSNANGLMTIYCVAHHPHLELLYRLLDGHERACFVHLRNRNRNIARLIRQTRLRGIPLAQATLSSILPSVSEQHVNY